MLSVLLFLLECVKDFLLVVGVGGLTTLTLAWIILYILAKLVEYECEVDLLLSDEYEPQSEEPDYVCALDGEKIIYDEDTQE